MTDLSHPGSVTGTVAYMSPEQAKGNPVDYRSDQFSFGIVLFELLSGTRPFRGNTAAETIAAIIRDEPEPLGKNEPDVPAPVRWLVERCLAKEAGERYDSTRDLGRELSTYRLHISEATSGAGEPVTPTPVTRRKGRVVIPGALAAALVGILLAGGFAVGRISSKKPEPSFKRITFRRGHITTASFTPDFQSVVYTASWEGRPRELYVQRLASADARSLGGISEGTQIVGVSGGDVAIIKRENGTIARLPLEGGTPRELLKDIRDAAWDRNGTRFAIIRTVKGRERLEYPVGKVIREAEGLEAFGQTFVSPDGERLAFTFSPNATKEAKDICVADQSGEWRTLSKGWNVNSSLPWSPDGNEIWFTARRRGSGTELHAVTLSGVERLVARLPGDLSLEDIAPDGRLLLTGQNRRKEMRGRMAGDAAERDLSWLDGTDRPVLASDGTQLLFLERDEGGGVESSTYHWRMDGSTPKRLGDGTPYSVSPDWTTALVAVGFGEKIELKLVPIGAGETTTLPEPPPGITGGRYGIRTGSDLSSGARTPKGRHASSSRMSPTDCRDPSHKSTMSGHFRRTGASLPSAPRRTHPMRSYRSTAARRVRSVLGN